MGKGTTPKGIEDARGVVATPGAEADAVDAAAGIVAAAIDNAGSTARPADRPAAEDRAAEAAGVADPSDATRRSEEAAGVAVLGASRKTPGVAGDRVLDPLSERAVTTGAATSGGAVSDPVASNVGGGGGILPGTYSAEGAFRGDPEARGMKPGAARAVAALVEAEVRRQLVADRPSSILGADGQPVELPHDLRISSARDGFRRGGIAHPAEPTPRRSSDFTPEQLRAIESEKVLFVQRV